MKHVTEKLPKKKLGSIDKINHLERHIEKLKKALIYAEDLIDTVREPFLVLDTDLRVVTANAAFYSTFKVSKRNTKGVLIYALGNNQWDIPELRILLEQVLSHRARFKNFEVYHNFPNIGRKKMFLNARRIASQQLILLAIEDSSEKKRLKEAKASNEKRFRALIEKSEDAIALVNMKGKVLYASPSTKRVTGFTPKEFKNLTNPFALVPGDDKTLVSKLFEDLLQKPTITERIVYRILHKDKSHRWIESVMTNLLDDQNVKAIVINYRDVTKRKELENQKDDFIGIASHELKTPVTSIKAYTQILKKRFEKQGDIMAAQNLARMDAQINRMNSLISDLLDVTKIETGKIVFNKLLFDFDSLVKEVTEETQLISAKHTIVRKGTVKKKVFADRERIGLVLVNLLTNAIKYSPGAIKVIVHLSADKKNVIVGVQDFGIGIEKKKQSKVFERFFRVDRQKGETYPGLGLGLYIASEIVKRHYGNMWLKSTVGKGSTFYFSIPVKGSRIK